VRVPPLLVLYFAAGCLPYYYLGCGRTKSGDDKKKGRTVVYIVCTFMVAYGNMIRNIIAKIMIDKTYYYLLS